MDESNVRFGCHKEQITQVVAEQSLAYLAGRLFFKYTLPWPLNYFFGDTDEIYSDVLGLLIQLCCARLSLEASFVTIRKNTSSHLGHLHSHRLNIFRARVSWCVQYVAVALLDLFLISYTTKQYPSVIHND